MTIDLVLPAPALIVIAAGGSTVAKNKKLKS
jgi:hypothetical protein